MNYRSVEALAKASVCMSVVLFSCVFSYAENNTELLFRSDCGAPSHYKQEKLKHHSFSYSNTLARLYFNHPVNQQDSYQVGLGYDLNHFSWAKPLHLRQNNFNTASFFLGGGSFSNSQFAYDGSIDAKLNMDHPGLQTSKMRLTAHGAYFHNASWHFHYGAIAMLGMHHTTLLPILGIDYVQTKKLSYKLIFPSTASILYSNSSRVTSNLSLRSVWAVERCGNDESTTRKSAIISFRALALEAGINIKICKQGLINLHIGKTFNERLHIRTHHGNSCHPYRMENAPYVGLSASLVL